MYALHEDTGAMTGSRQDDSRIYAASREGTDEPGYTNPRSTAPGRTVLLVRPRRGAHTRVGSSADWVSYTGLINMF